MALIKKAPVKPPMSQKSLKAHTKIERLKRLLDYRRFSKNEMERLRTQLDREIYIRIALDLGKIAGYNERRLYRLGHEINRSFEKSMLPQYAHQLITQEIEEDIYDFTREDLVSLLDVTEEEFVMMVGTQ